MSFTALNSASKRGVHENFDAPAVAFRRLGILSGNEGNQVCKLASIPQNTCTSHLAFRIRCELVQEIRGNFKDKFRRKGGDEALLCTECPDREMEYQSHCVVCPGWTKLRSGLDLSKMEDLVIFFQKLLAEKMRGKVGSD